jgi:hypothetical protein
MDLVDLPGKGSVRDGMRNGCSLKDGVIYFLLMKGVFCSGIRGIERFLNPFLFPRL